MSENKFEITYEIATKKLYEIIDKIENGQVTLESTNSLLEEGKELLEFCYKSLDKTKGKLTQLKETLDKLEEE